MAKVTAYLCEDTGQLFLEKKDYDRHRRSYLKDKKELARKDELKNKRVVEFKRIRDSIKTYPELVSYLNRNLIKLINLYIETSNQKPHQLWPGYRCTEEQLRTLFESKPKFKFKGDKVLDYGMSLSFNYEMSNSYSAPKGKTVNWCGRDPKKPSHLPGLYKMGLSFSSEHEILSGIVRNVLAELGLNHCAGTEPYYEMFSEDWRFVLVGQLAHAISNNKTKVLSTEFKRLCIEKFNSDIDTLKNVVELQGFNNEEIVIYLNHLFDIENEKVNTLNNMLSTFKIGAEALNQLDVDEVSVELPILD